MVLLLDGHFDQEVQGCTYCIQTFPVKVVFEQNCALQNEKVCHDSIGRLNL